MNHHHHHHQQQHHHHQTMDQHIKHPASHHFMIKLNVDITNQMMKPG